MPSSREKSNNSFNVYQSNVEILIGKIEPFCEELIHQDERITYSKISRLTNVSIDTLLYYRPVRTKIDQIILQQKERIENSLLEHLDIILSFTHSFSTKRNILKNLGISKYQLKNYPKLKTRIHEYFSYQTNVRLSAKQKRKTEVVFTLNSITCDKEGKEIRIYTTK